MEIELQLKNDALEASTRRAAPIQWIHLLHHHTSRHDTRVSSASGVSSSLEVVESVMNTSTATKLNRRFDEGYDVPGDELTVCGRN